MTYMDAGDLSYNGIAYHHPDALLTALAEAGCDAIGVPRDRIVLHTTEPDPYTIQWTGGGWISPTEIADKIEEELGMISNRRVDEARAVRVAAEEHLAKVTLKRNKAQGKVDAAKKAVRMARSAERLAAFPEPLEGNIIRIRRRFRREGKWYTYAAIRAANHWYTTAADSTAKVMTWSELLDWLGDDGDIAVVSR